MPKVLNSIGLLLLLMSATVFARQTVSIVDDSGSVSLASGVVFFEDKKQSLSVEEVKKILPSSWSTFSRSSASFGFSESAIWLKFSIKNNTANTQKLFLHIDNALLDDIRLYNLSRNTLVNTGDSFPFAQRPVNYPTFLFPLKFDSGESTDYLMRIASANSLKIPLSLWHQDDFFVEERFSLLAYGLFLGIILIMSLYNTAIYFFVRDVSYLVYGFFTLAVVCFFMTIHGHSYQWLWPEAVAWQQVAAATINGIGITSIALFTHTLLGLRRPDWLYYLSMGMIVYCVIAFVLLLFLPYRLGALLQATGISSVSIVSVLIGTVLVFRKEKVARLFVSAWLMFFIGSLLNAADTAGITNFSAYSLHVAAAGAIFGVFFLSLSLADRINREKNDKELAQQESIRNLERYYDVYENALEGIFTLSLGGRLLTANPAMLNTLDAPSIASYNGDAENQKGYRLSKLDFVLFTQKIQEESQLIDHELQLYNKQGLSIWVRISARIKQQGSKKSVIEGTLFNVTLRKQAEQELQFLASHDSLTGFYNRRIFEEKTAEQLQKVQAKECSAYLLYMDLDRFKLVNDLCGHSAGDKLLKQLSRRLLKKLQGFNGDNLIARLGGDEFGVILGGADLATADEAAEGIREAVEQFVFVWQDNRFTLGASIGLMEICPHHKSVEELLLMVDSACYQAKNRGRNRVHLFKETDENLKNQHREMRWVNTLKEALEKDRFFLVTQNIATNQEQHNSHHYEVLLRLLDENGEVIPPGQFLVAAERYNLMSSIDRWVVEHYFYWLYYHPCHLDNLSSANLNLSMQSVGDKGFAEFLQHYLQSYNIPPEKICFEITESAAITNLDNTHTFIDRFRKLGCRFALDDFGTGFSSYAYLKELDIDYLKIDGSFIKNIHKNEVDRAMVKSMSDMAHAIGLKTVAEFVESEEIQQILLDIGVDYSQGYLIHRPEPLESEVRLERNRHGKQA